MSRNSGKSLFQRQGFLPFFVLFRESQEAEKTSSWIGFSSFGVGTNLPISHHNPSMINPGVRIMYPNITLNPAGSTQAPSDRLPNPSRITKSPQMEISAPRMPNRFFRNFIVASPIRCTEPRRKKLLALLYSRVFVRHRQKREYCAKYT